MGRGWRKLVLRTPPEALVQQLSARMAGRDEVNRSAPHLVF